MVCFGAASDQCPADFVVPFLLPEVGALARSDCSPLARRSLAGACGFDGTEAMGLNSGNGSMVDRPDDAMAAH